MRAHQIYIFEVMVMTDPQMAAEQIDSVIDQLLQSVRLTYGIRQPLAVSEHVDWGGWARAEMLISAQMLNLHRTGLLGEYVTMRKPEVPQLFRDRSGEIFFVKPEACNKIVGDFAMEFLKCLHGEEIDDLELTLFPFADNFISNLIEADCDVSPGDALEYYNELLTDHLRDISLANISFSDIETIALEIREELQTPYGRRQAKDSESLPF